MNKLSKHQPKPQTQFGNDLSLQVPPRTYRDTHHNFPEKKRSLAIKRKKNKLDYSSKTEPKLGN